MNMDLQEEWINTIYTPKEFGQMKSDELIECDLPIIFKLIGSLKNCDGLTINRARY